MLTYEIPFLKIIITVSFKKSSYCSKFENQQSCYFLCCFFYTWYL